MTARRWGPPGLIGAALAAMVSAGCTKPTEEIPPAEVGTVTAYGVTLDESAGPKEVTYVLLRALADDVQAAQAHQHDQQQAALKLTYSLAAYSRIEQRLLDLANQTRVQKANSLGDERASKLFELVKYWAPIVGYYIRSFDTDLAAASRKMSLREDGAESARVFYAVAHDPAETDRAKQHKAVLDIELCKEKSGGKSYWRVARISYAGVKAEAGAAPTTRPASTAPAAG